MRGVAKGAVGRERSHTHTIFFFFRASMHWPKRKRRIHGVDVCAWVCACATHFNKKEKWNPFDCADQHIHVLHIYTWIHRRAHTESHTEKERERARIEWKMKEKKIWNFKVEKQINAWKIGQEMKWKLCYLCFLSLFEYSSPTYNVWLCVYGRWTCVRCVYVYRSGAQTHVHTYSTYTHTHSHTHIQQ